MSAPHLEPGDDLARARRCAPWSVEPLHADWSAALPARVHLRDLRRFPTVDDLNERLGAPVRFVPQPARRRRRGRTDLYEYRAAALGEVMTRPGCWHDLWNALVWASFPRAKLHLTRLLCEAQAAWTMQAGAAGRLPGARLRAQDLLAMFDEGGVVGGGERLVWFGHALYEHRWLVPRRPLRGSLLRVAPAASLDEAIAAALGEPAFLAERLPTLTWDGDGAS